MVSTMAQKLSSDVSNCTKWVGPRMSPPPAVGSGEFELCCLEDALLAARHHVDARAIEDQRQLIEVVVVHEHDTVRVVDLEADQMRRLDECLYGKGGARPMRIHVHR